MKHPQCTICQDPRSHDIESEIADGARLRPLARKYAVSYDAIWRHWRRHLTVEQKDRLKFGDAPAHKLKGMVAEAEISVLKDLDYSRHMIIEALAAIPAEDGHARATLCGRLHENARIRGQISGELAKSPLVQITNTLNNNVAMLESPAFARFQARLIAVLRDLPDARDRIIAEFSKLEAAPAVLPAIGETFEKEAA